MGRIITLTSDFGLADEYVGVMKGVILAREASAVVVDLTHLVEPHAVRQAAFILASAWHFFPAGTIHLAVVDPGVGSERRVVLLEVDKHYFLAPDNGLLSLVANQGSQARAWQVIRTSLFLDRVGKTFHGRDVFAPVAASLAGGLDPEQVGPPLLIEDLVSLTDLSPQVGPEEGCLVGRVVQVDRFGNLVSNIGREAVRSLCGAAGLDRLRVMSGSTVITGVAETYAAQPPGTLLALFGSRDTLELAVNRGRAGELLQVGVGAEIMVKK